MKKLRLFILDYQRSSFVKVCFNIGLALFIPVLILYWGFSTTEYVFNWESIFKYKSLFIRGYINTFIISLFSLICSLIIGFFIGIGQKTPILPIRYLCKAYIDLIRGTPLLVQIYIFFYIVANTVSLSNRYVSGVLILSIFSGAYIAEIIRGGLEEIEKTQEETALSLGLKRKHIYQYIYMPQLIRRVLPALAGQLASLIKDSSLLSIISVREFTLVAKEVNAATFSTLESYFPLAIGYLLLTYPIVLYSKRLEKNLTI